MGKRVLRCSALRCIALAPPRLVPRLIAHPLTRTHRSQATATPPLNTHAAMSFDMELDVQRAARKREPADPALGVHYSGDISDKQPHGHGKMQWSNGDSYEGEWKDGQRQGVGCYRWSDGRVYEGEWAANKRSGLGAEWNKQGQLVKCGRWKNSKLVDCAVPLRCIPEGRWLSDAALRAKRDHPDSSLVLLAEDGRFYIGAVNVQGQPHGQGASFHPDGSPEITLHADADESLSGQWINGKLHGRATQILPTGDCYGGLFKDGLRHDLGVSSRKDGPRYQGEWAANQRSGLGAEWNKQEKLVKCGRWENDKLVKSCAVPLRCIPVGMHLCDAAWQAKLDHPDDSALLPNGSHYIGQLNADGQPNGQGSTFHPDGSLAVMLLPDAADPRNNGKWVDGSVFGRAHQWHADGALFDGSFKDGLYDGVGALDASDGRYEGQFVAGKRCGFGVRWGADGEIKECGRWEGNTLLTSCAVPLRLLSDKLFLSSHAKTASLLFPHGHYYIGSLNALIQRHGFGRMFSKAGVLSQFRMWLDGQPQGRKALIFGNKDYAKPISELFCCINDATDIRTASEELAFDCTPVPNASRREMTDAIKAFIASLQANDLVFIMFSGHGAETDGETYLLPTDFKNGSYRDDAISLNWILRELNRKSCNLTSIIVLDCCRADSKNCTFRGSTRAVNNSARVPTSVNRCVRLPTTGSFFIAYSSDPGTVAHEDDDERNGWFTGCLLRYLTEPGLRLTEIFMKTRKALLAKSKGTQCSWDSNSLVDDIVLKPILENQ